MGLFSWLWPDKPTSLEHAGASQLHESGGSPLQSIPDAEVTKLFAELRTMLAYVIPLCASEEFPNLTRIEHEAAMINPLNDIKTEWINIDKSNLNPEDAEFMYELLMTWLPEIVCQYRERAVRYGVRSTLSAEIRSGVYGLTGRKYLTVLRSYQADLLKIKDRQWRTGYLKTIPKKGLVVPSLGRQDRELAVTLSNLNRLWVDANAKSLSTEDRFFVDEVAARYFPDAWSILESFAYSDEAMQQEAKTIFLEQVSLMCRRLEKLIQVTQQGSLDEMRAQASFLREVTA